MTFVVHVRHFGCVAIRPHEVTAPTEAEAIAQVREFLPAPRFQVIAALAKGAMAVTA